MQGHVDQIEVNPRIYDPCHVIYRADDTLSHVRGENVWASIDIDRSK